MSSLIEFSDITKKYQVGQEVLLALNHVNLKIDHGEFVAIMGESGSGKSTAMNILGLLDSPTSGEYFLGGHNTKELTSTQQAKIRNEQIGFVFQSFFLLPRLNSIENISLPLSYAGIHRTKAHDIAKTLLVKLNIENLGYKKPNEMSGGQQQRVAIARALITNPKVILADEPTGALDSKTGGEILDLFSDLYNKEKRTVILVTHDPIVSSRCHRILMLKDGKILIDEKNENPGPDSIQKISNLFLQTINEKKDIESFSQAGEST